MELWVIVNEIFLSESSSSDDDFIPRDPIELRPRILRFVEDVVDAYSDAEFREHFRMNRPTFQHILPLIEDKVNAPIFERGRQVIPPKVQLLVSLWYFGTPDSYRSIVSRFNMGKATALRRVRRVTNALLDISNNIKCWSSQEIKNGFREMVMPDAIGCIDGIHIRIPKPNDHGISYINRKGICDHCLKFIHASAGEVGSYHDAIDLKRSEIWNYRNKNVDKKFPNNTHLLGISLPASIDYSIQG